MVASHQKDSTEILQSAETEFDFESNVPSVIYTQSQMDSGVTLHDSWELFGGGEFPILAPIAKMLSILAAMPSKQEKNYIGEKKLVILNRPCDFNHFYTCILSRCIEN